MFEIVRAEPLTVIRNALQFQPDGTPPLVQNKGSRPADTSDFFLTPAFERQFETGSYTAGTIDEALDTADYINTEIANQEIIRLENIRDPDWHQSRFHFTRYSARTFTSLAERIIEKTTLLDIVKLNRAALMQQFSAEHLVTMVLLDQNGSLIPRVDPGLYCDPRLIGTLRATYPSEVMSPGTFKTIIDKLCTRQYLLHGALAYQVHPSSQHIQVSERIKHFNRLQRNGT